MVEFWSCKVTGFSVTAPPANDKGAIDPMSILKCRSWSATHRRGSSSRNFTLWFVIREGFPEFKFSASGTE
jgi:hypothetical protein